MKIKLPKIRLKLAVIFFAVIGSGISAYTASKAIFGKPDFELFKKSPRATPILPPAYPDYHLERIQLLHNKIERMKRYLDSLSLHDSSKYHGILRSNPKLVENIQSIESLFHPLIKK